MVGTETPINLMAGLRLRRLREAKQLTQRDLARETEVRFGKQGMVVSQQISRIEKGQVEKPPIVDLLHIGEVLGLAPAHILEMYGLMTPSKKPRGEFELLDPRLREVLNLTERLPPDLREELLGMVELAALGVVAKARRRLQEREPE